MSESTAESPLPQAAASVAAGALEAAPSGGALVQWMPKGLDGWVFEHLALEEDGACLFVKLKKRERGTRDWLDIRITPKRDRSNYFKQLKHVQVAYRGNLVDRSEQLRAALHDLILSIANGVDGLFDHAAPGASLADALGRGASGTHHVFGRDALLALFNPHFRPGDTVVDGWYFADSYPANQVPGLARLEEPTMVLDFRHPLGRQILFALKQRHEDSQAHMLSAHLALTVLAGFGNPEGSDTLQAMVSFALQLQEHEGLSWEFPEKLDIVVAPRRPMLSAAEIDNPIALLGDGSGESALSTELVKEDEILNLSILSDCSQQCNFCSVKDTTAPIDGGDVTFSELCHDLLENRKRGVRRVRWNGYDPLSFSRIVDLMRFATRLGYEEAQVFSPCTLLAQPGFCQDVVESLPTGGARFYVPMYSMDPHTHDRVVGREGAHALAMKALEHLEQLVGADHIHLLSVLTQENVDAVPGVYEHAMKRGYRCTAHMPYPSLESRGDRFYQSAPRQSDAARLVAPLAKASTHPQSVVHHLLEGVAPCVTFREMMKHDVPLKRWLEAPEVKPILPGTDYRDERYRHGEDTQAFVAYSVPCPNAATCALVQACPGEVLRGYADLYGMSEFRGVSLRELVAGT